MKIRTFIVISAFLLVGHSGAIAYAEDLHIKGQSDEISKASPEDEMTQSALLKQKDINRIDDSDIDFRKELEQISLDAGNEYWEIEIGDQKIKDIQNHQSIKEDYLEYKKVELSEKNPVVELNKIPEKAIEKQVFTASDIILNIIDPKYHDKKIDLDFNETNLSDIIMIIGEIGNMNIVLDPSLKNNTFDLNLKQVTIKEALLLISKSYDLGFQQVENSLYITRRENLREQNIVSKVIKVHNINVDEAITLINDLDLKTSASQEINSLILVGEPDVLVRAENIIKQIDQAQPQVVLEAKIIEINKDALKEFGIDWSDSMSLSFQESGRPLEFDNVEDVAGSVYKAFAFQRSPLQITQIIKMLENQNKAKVLSNPRITTLNNKEAEIFVGDRIPYTITNVTGGVATTDVRWVEPGIRLSITPSIIEDDFVVLKVKPEVSYIFAFRGPNDEFPHVKTREALAYVRVKNHQPFILGGLLNQEDKKNLYKVPFLGNVPLLGNLFKYEKHTVLDTELIITIIPTIVQGSN
ncbi:MAG: hypothetical protein KKF78_00380 [Candidatus Omnitrophica bacterium]|nr:hypothetical protein [Candidatus Omnitrophota bacterium]MBU1995592.1 hypothetical protein [Candidatus Omnitrophota bacterium]